MAKPEVTPVEQPVAKVAPDREPTSEPAIAPASAVPEEAATPPSEVTPAADGRRRGFPLLIPAAAAPPLLALLLLWLLSRRNHRFRLELRRLFGVEWKGRLPVSQLRSFVQAHGTLYERLEGVHGVLETTRSESAGVDDEETLRLDQLLRTIDQRRQHLLDDVKRLAAGRKGGETTLERALRIHAARMGMLDALDDLVQGLAELHGKSRV